MSTNEPTLGDEARKKVGAFTYIVGIIDKHGEFGYFEVQTRRAKVKLPQLKKIWNPEVLLSMIKARIFNTNIKTVLLYRADTGRATTVIAIKVQKIIQMFSQGNAELLVRHH